MRIGTVLRDLHQDELDLARTLVRVADEHRADHEVFHLGHGLAVWPLRHAREIATVAGEFGEQLDPEPSESPPLVDSARRWLAERSGRSAEAELVMLRDLREVYLRASSVLLDREMIGQVVRPSCTTSSWNWRPGAKWRRSVRPRGRTRRSRSPPRKRWSSEPGSGTGRRTQRSASACVPSATLPLGFLALMVATTTVAMLQLSSNLANVAGVVSHRRIARPL